MTMPHLMNCPHSEEGWCLSCVKELWDEGKTIELSRQLRVSVSGHSMSVGEVVSIELISMNRSVSEVMGNGPDSTRHFALDDETVTELKVTCVSRRASYG